MPTDPTVAICRVVMSRFADANAAATKGSPLDRARAKLGNRYAEVVGKALQARTIAAISGPGAVETQRMVEATGQLGATTVLVSIVADAIGDIIDDAAWQEAKEIAAHSVISDDDLAPEIARHAAEDAAREPVPEEQAAYAALTRA